MEFLYVLVVSGSKLITLRSADDQLGRRHTSVYEDKITWLLA
jgi:hypothetical protein